MPSRLDMQYNSGDFLHPNVKGYQRLADMFPVELFERWVDGSDEFM